jgi:hypothetical protein
MGKRPAVSPAERRIVVSALADSTITMVGRYRCVHTVLKNQFNLGYAQARSVIDGRATKRSFSDGRR